MHHFATESGKSKGQFYTQADALLAKLDQNITKKRDIKLAVMQQLLTGKIRLPGFGPPAGAGLSPLVPER